jgi:CSLREA domain-containing protein
MMGDGRVRAITPEVVLIIACARRYRCLLLAFVLGALGCLLWVTPTLAATIQVTTSANENGTNLAACSLREAIQAANTDATFGGCPAGSGADTIVLQAGATYFLTAVDNVAPTFGANGLPIVVTSLTIQGNGATIARDPAAPDLRLLDITAGTVALDALTLTGGRRMSGGIGDQASALLVRDTAAVTVSGTTITNNQSDNVSVVIARNGGTLHVVNSTITNNSTAFLGAIGTSGAGDVLTMHNGTMVGNTSTTPGGAGGIFNSFAADLTITNTIIADNGSSNCSFTTTPSVSTNNLADDATCGAGFTQKTSAELGLNPAGLRENGGPTQTIALLPGSAAIDAGTPSGCFGPTGAILTSDQRGVTRPQDGDGSGASTCDVGAFERQPGVLQLSSPAYSAAEAGGSAAITVIRTGGTDGAVSGTVSETDGTATSPGDYTNAPLAVSFAGGQTSASVNLPIVNDTLFEGDETVNLALGSVTGGASLGAQTSAVLTIVDDDVATPTPTATPTVTSTPSVTSTPTVTPTGTLPPTVTPTPTATATFTATATSTSAATATVVPVSVAIPEDDTDKKPRLTEEQQQDKQHTNQSNRDDLYTEGNVVEVHQDESPPYVVIANRDGLVSVNLLCGSQCPAIRVGDYLTAEGEKQSEVLFDATDASVSHPGR